MKHTKHWHDEAQEVKDDRLDAIVAAVRLIEDSVPPSERARVAACVAAWFTHEEG